MAVTVLRGRTELKLVEGMKKAGLSLVDRAPLYDKLIGKALYREDELIFNRAAGPSWKGSSFCVLATREKDGAVMLHWYNPDPAGTNFRRDQFIRKAMIPPNSSDDMIAGAIGQIVKDSQGKKPNEFYFQPHAHFGSLYPPLLGPDGRRIRSKPVEYDDGVSFLTDNIRKAMFYHIDHYALTTHNSFPKDVFALLSWATHYLGMAAVPSVELTAPLREPNGPHILIWMRNTAIAEHVDRMILSKREHLDMPSYFSGMGMKDMLDVLFALQKANLLALGIAHPVNFNSPRLPIPIVGLYTAVDTGALTLDQAHEYAQHFDSIAMWNPSLYAKASEVPVENETLKRFLRDLNQKHVGNRRLWVNQTNFALAQELHDCFGIYTHFETDEHATLPFIREGTGYGIAGDSLGMGTTVIELPENFKGRPSASDLIALIRSRAVEKMYGRVFAVMRPEAITVHGERAALTDRLRRIAARADHALTMRYAGMLVRDFFDLLFSGEFDDIGNMPGK